jgi:hypothetical protein
MEETKREGEKHHLRLINVGFSVSQGNRRRQCPQSKLEIFQIRRDSEDAALYSVWCVNLMEYFWPHSADTQKQFEQ